MLEPQSGHLYRLHRSVIKVIAGKIGVKVDFLFFPMIPLDNFPFSSIDSSLFENSTEEISPYVPPVGVRNTDAGISPDHELMSATGIWTRKPKLTQARNQFLAFNGSEWWH